MRKLSISLLIISLFCCFSGAANAQQRQQKTMSQVNAEKQIKKEKQVNKTEYKHPLINGLLVGVNIADPLLRALGQDYGTWEALAELNMHNRFFPEISMGVGNGKSISDNEEFKVECKPGFFTKFGMNYNFTFNNDNAGYFFIGAKYGISTYKTSYQGLNYNDGYWDPSGPYNLPDQKFTSHWLEFGFGIRVNIYKNISMGWCLQWRPLLKQGSTENADPWYIPGYGVKGTGYGINYNIYYQLPFFK